MTIVHDKTCEERERERDTPTPNQSLDRLFRLYLDISISS